MDDRDGLKDYAGGWISERKGTKVPPFLRVAYIVIAGACAAYLVYFMNGDVGNKTRGPLVQQLNQATHAANGFMYFVAALIVLGLAALSVFAARKPHDD